METGLTRKAIISIFLLVIISRAALAFTGYIGINLFASYTEPAVYENQAPGVIPETAMKLPHLLKETEGFKLSHIATFDSYLYLKIATQGYDKYAIDEPHPPANWVFFPLFPLLLYVSGVIVGLFAQVDSAVLGMLLSNLLFCLSLVYVYALSLKHGLNERQARTVLILMLLYPTSLFYSLPYTESLFLLLSAASIYYATDKRYALAFLAASLSTVTRVPGFINLFFVVGTVVIHEGFPLTRRYIRPVLYGLLSLVPMGLYLLYMRYLTGDFLAPFHEQSLGWYRYTSAPFTNYANYFEKPYFMAPGGWDNGLIAFVVSTAVFIVYLTYLGVNGKKMIRQPHRLLLWVYGALLIVIPFSSQPWYLASVVRYMMVCIPFYLYLVKLTANRENVLFAYQIFFACLNVITTIGFFNGYSFMA